MRDHHEQARQLAELGFLEAAVHQLGYRAELVENHQQTPYPTLLVNLEPEPGGTAGRVMLTFYPVPEEDAGPMKYLQYLAVLPGTAAPESLARAAELLPFLNNRLVVGHFGIGESPAGLHFRYVQTLPDLKLPGTEDVSEVLRMVAGALGLFGGLLVEFARGGMSLEKAKAEVARRLG